MLTEHLMGRDQGTQCQLLNSCTQLLCALTTAASSVHPTSLNWLAMAVLVELAVAAAIKLLGSEPRLTETAQPSMAAWGGEFGTRDAG